jgi:hypothetical protein
MEELRNDEYQGTRLGCFHCKKPIDPDTDYVRLQWRGRTWELAYNFHQDCLPAAVASGPPDGEARHE